jgi:sigma54-dependent transcription regulator
VPVNVRVLAGSKRDLKHMVADGKFREDLDCSPQCAATHTAAASGSGKDIPC